MGDVVRLPERDLLKPRSCFLCRHYVEQSAWCGVFEEPIDSELFAASDCEAYEEGGDGQGH